MSNLSQNQGVDMDILCLGARIIRVELATELVASFLNLCFSGEEWRHR